jgi:hypothetical protein
MFQYKTWRAFGGYNLTFPGSLDYQQAGHLGSQEAKRLNRGIFAQTLEQRRTLGRIQGRKNVESGWAAELGRRSGKLAAESGHIQNLGHTYGPKNGRLNGLKTGKRTFLEKTGIFSLSLVQKTENSKRGGLTMGPRSLEEKTGIHGQTPEQHREAASLGGHSLWHVRRNLPNPRCAFCSEQGLIVAFA